jgi:hypothetical protein
MIKIQEHLNRADAEDFLDKLAEGLWNNLNKKLANGKGFYKNSLIEKCKSYKKESKLKRYRVEYANDDIATAKRHHDFFKYLLNSKAAKLKALITSRPTEFSGIKTEILNILNITDLYTGTPNDYNQTKFGILLSSTIFNYKAFRGSDFCMELFAEIGFNSATCPYCNEKKISIVELVKNSTSKDKLKAYLDLDHFYPKSQHPYFALSFFNLIPSCHDCNSGDKGEKPFTIESHVHPYHESFDDLYQFRVPLATMLGDTVDEIFIDNLKLKATDITLNDLKLEDRYQGYLKQVESLIDYYSKYNHYLDSPQEDMFLESIFNLNGGVPLYKRDILKNERGKMSRDILKQIDVKGKLNLN